MRYERLAPAKINLFLHVGPLGDDGYHPLCSLVTFADVGDVVALNKDREVGFSIEGPFAEGLSPEAPNLVTRARDLWLAGYPDTPPAFHLTLDKRLPIAAGLGGGSADAAATLALLGETLGWERDEDEDEALARIAAGLGADVPMCLRGQPAMAGGRGDELDFPPVFPDLDAVLVNPGVPAPTGAVYGAYDDAGAPGDASEPSWPEPMQTVGEVGSFLQRCRNDLEAPAISLQPAIAEVLAALRGRPETLFARMSGSGATCFAICANRRDRQDLAFSLAAAHPGWWVQPCTLAGFRP
jgi:4-diphosphocytidyl-2-C-methyl-D-erythritol kinase